ncbi:MAG: hypothetical protein U0441_19660 [Polyangiaceae bacterium]
MTETHRKGSNPASDRAPTKPLFAARLAFAVGVTFTASVACVAAATEPSGPQKADVHPLTSATESGSVGAAPLDTDSGAPEGGIPDGGCPYGSLEDPHRGFVRCLSQGEKSPINGPDSPPPPSATPTAAPTAAPAPSAAPTATPTAAPSAAPTAAPSTAPSAPPPGPPPIVEIKTPKFENGDVPKAEKNLSGKKVYEAIAKCVADAGGITGKNPSLKVEFLVRSRGKAEGVEVTPTGVSAEAARCVRTFLKNRSVGVPTADPTGVTVIYNLKPSGK